MNKPGRKSTAKIMFAVLVQTMTLSVQLITANAQHHARMFFTEERELGTQLSAFLRCNSLIKTQWTRFSKFIWDCKIWGFHGSDYEECRLLGYKPSSYLKQTKTNSMALSPRANYTDWATATCRRNLVPTFVDRGVSRGQRSGSPTVVNLSFLDRQFVPHRRHITSPLQSPAS
jgi:hypothetical protein